MILWDWPVKWLARPTFDVAVSERIYRNFLPVSCPSRWNRKWRFVGHAGEIHRMKVFYEKVASFPEWRRFREVLCSIGLF